MPTNSLATTVALRLQPSVEMTNLPSIDVELLSGVAGGAACFATAKAEAIKFSAQQNKVSPSSIRVTNARRHSEEKGVRYYAVELDNRDRLNVGLNASDCTLAGINYVTDGA